jgi:hypothetical protein
MTQGVLGPQAYTINLLGSSSGTFTVTDGSTGDGTFTYTHTGTTGHLRLNYGGQYQGDYDDMNLFFNGASGSTTPSNFSGTQSAGTNVGPISGTFTYQ